VVTLMLGFPGDAEPSGEGLRSAALLPRTPIAAGRQVLLFEPRELPRLQAQRLLHDAGLQVDAVGSLDQARSALRDRLPDVLVTGLGGDERNCAELIDELRAVQPRLRVIELVDDAVGKGAKVLTGGKATGGKGFFYPATVLTNVPNNAKMLNEEIFGPVASIQTFKSDDEVIKRANDTEYGLVAYLYTKDLSRGMRVSEKLDFGMIGLNRGVVSDPAAPFGGTKQSGIGREGAHEGMMEFMETQYVSVSW